MMNFETEMNEKITTIIEEMNIDEQYYLFCEYCEKANYYDDRPESVDSIDELFCGMKPSKILDKLEGLNTNWDYFCFNGYGNVEQWEGIDDIIEVVDYIIKNEDALENEDIQEILDRYTRTEELNIDKEDFYKVVQELESKEIAYEYDEEETELQIFSDDYDVVTEILDELEIEY